MNRTTTTATATSATREIFGLVAWLEQTRVVLPLKGVECRFTACGDLLEVEIDQVFHQNNPRVLDCLYSFPLPGDAAVYRCEMHVNGRVIRARVEEAAEARRQFQERKAAGHRAVLVEMERENLFTLSLGNVQPNDVVVIRLAYFQTLTRLQDWTSFHIPSCPGVRYIPGVPLLRDPSGRGTVDDTDQVPDASRITPPRLDRLHPDAAYFSVRGTVEHPAGGLRDLSSPSHPLLVREAAKVSTVTLADNAAVPDSDFVVRWTEVAPEQVAPAGWVCRADGESHALIRLVAPNKVGAEDRVGRDFYFLVDRSGSMSGLKWDKAAQAFREFLKLLGPADRAWATFFETGFQDLAERPMAAADLLAMRAVRRLEGMGTAGGTELQPALDHVLDKCAEHSAERRTSLVLITDGEVGNEAAILRSLQTRPDLRVDTFGIDTTVNDAFLKRLAAQQRGLCHLVMPTDDIAGTVSRLGERLRHPVLINLAVFGGWQWAGAAPADLHAGEVLSVPVRAQGEAGPLTVTGLTADGQPWRCELALEERNLAALRLLWARQRIDHHLARKETKAALALAKANNLICPGAAFVAWDNAEKVAVGGPEALLYQPAMEPLQIRSVRDLSCQLSRVEEPESRGLCANFREVGHFRKRPSRPGSRRGWFGLAEATPAPAEAKTGLAEWDVIKALHERLSRFIPDQLCRRLVELLEEWVLHTPRAPQERMEALMRLRDQVEAAPSERADILGLLREWIKAVATEPARLQAELLQVLAEIERTAGVGPQPGV